jgi:hypothetical protein
MFHSMIESAWRRPMNRSFDQGRYRKPAAKLLRRLWLERLEDRIVPEAHIGSMTFPTISLAMNAAVNGDTITVDPGTYNELVTVNKSVNLLGAQAGVDARNPARTGLPATESVVDGNNGTTSFDVTASNVTIDGFTVQGDTNPNQFGFGILLGAGTSGAHVLNNIIQDNIAGLSLANMSTPALIQHNLFRNDNNTGPVSGTGIYSDQFNAGGNLNNVTIDANAFVNDNNDGIIIGPTSATQGALNIAISNNTFDGDGQAIFLFNTTVSSISGNTITGLSTATSPQVEFGGGVNSFQVSQNFIQNGAAGGIRFDIDFLPGGSANSNVRIFDNNIQGNATAGLELTSTGYTGPLDARNNWWGSNTGPTIASNSGGRGEQIVDPNSLVNYSPWLIFGIDTQPNAPGFQGNLTRTFSRDSIVGRLLETGDLWVGSSTGSSFTNSRWGALNPNVTWVDVVTGDFNGDGAADIAARDAATGNWWVALSNGTTFTNQLWGAWSPMITWVDVKVGDFNGDGKADIVGRDSATGNWWVAQSTGSSFTNALWATWNPNVTWVDVNVGNFAGNKTSDLTGRWLQGGSWWTAVSTGSTFNTSIWAAWNPNLTWVDVQVGDFDGDGKSDITGRFLQGGSWFTGLSTGSSFTTSLWGMWSPALNWVDVKVGNFTGNGKDDIIGRDSATGNWWVGVSSGTSFTNTLWATWSNALTWVDVQVGDFNGDGKADITGRAMETGGWFTGISTFGSMFSTSLWDTWSTAVTWANVRTGDFG